MTDFENDKIALEGETEINAFNEDTFGDSNVEWDEDEHALQIERMRIDGGRGDFEPRAQDGAMFSGIGTAGSDFFDLEKGSELIGDSLEPEGLETDADPVFLEEDAVDYEGISDLESREVTELFRNKSDSNGSHSRPIQGSTGLHRQKLDNHPVDVDIVNALPQVAQMPPMPMFPPRIPMYPTGIPMFPPGMRPMMHLPMPPMNRGMMPGYHPGMMLKERFDDPAILAVRGQGFPPTLGSKAPSGSGEGVDGS